MLVLIQEKEFARAFLPQDSPMYEAFVALPSVRVQPILHTQ